jgi:hypothetical protein
VEQRLTRLERIESLDAPYALVPASRLLASWSAGRPGARPGSGIELRAAA